jgi:arsenite methyltransferase
VSSKDIWSEWLLHRRFGGDARQMQTILDALYKIRDKVLEHASLGDNETLLDVGCGDGLIAFGALEKVKSSRCIFSDISQDLLDHARGIAQQMGVLDRCQFLRASADDLSAIDSASVDVVTTRSVLIYVEAKQRAFDEFYRVLKPGGRLSIFEPINRFSWPEPPNRFCGFDVTPVQHIAQKVTALFHRLQPPDTDPMLDFDERDLLTCAEKAGFKEVHLTLEAAIKPSTGEADWEAFLRSAGNPKIPSIEEAIQQTLTAQETEQLKNYLRPLVLTKQGVNRSAMAYLWAVKL